MPKILVIGESSKDIFVYCNALRLAPDLPVPVLQVESSTSNPGMAMNVWRNIQALGGDSEILTNLNWEEVTKTRYMHSDSNHMFMRVDSKEVIDPLDFDSISLEYDAIVISDYDKGYMTREIIERICENHSLVFIDTKKILGNWSAKASYVKINNYEYERSIEYLTPDLQDKIVRTRGGLGCEFRGVHYPVKASEVKDTSGAGDTFMAALVVKYLDTNSIETAINFANECASTVVQRRGVSLP
jgi:bifunctional ADP-heptose synthase (sugar kinase/adenylyltransferase)